VGARALKAGSPRPFFISDQAFLSTKFGLPLVEDDEAAACVVDEVPALDPDDEDAGA
jgi:hypothetical protein